MPSDNTDRSWHALFHDFPLFVRISFAAAMLIVVVAFLCLAFYAVIGGSREVMIGPTGFKSVPIETTLEKNCRLAIQEMSSWNQGISAEILALEAQVATKDHDLSETRQRCLTASANLPVVKNVFRCNTPIIESNRFVTSYSNPSNDYEKELDDITKERDLLGSRIANEKKERAQRQQQFDQRCLNSENQIP